MGKAVDRGLFLIFLAASLTSQVGHAQEMRPDSLGPELFKEKLNYIQYFNKSTLGPFIKKWNDKGRITVTLFGDSHVQPGIYPGELRKQLQAVRGQGGFGMIFPYSTARTYSAIDYFSSHKGSWQFARSVEFRPKLPLGVSGITARTSDSMAGFRIRFKKSQPRENKKIRVYFRQDKKSFDFRVRSGGRERLVRIDSVSKNPIELTFDKIDSAIYVDVIRGRANQTEFEFYGMSLESIEPGGLILHSMGIGGSRYGSLLEQKLFDSQLPTLRPDLVILDFGTNDILYDNAIPMFMESQIVNVILKVRKTAPGSLILLTTTQDMNRKGVNITAAEAFSDLIRKVARNQGCPFYDWYWISGGPEKMSNWFENGLAQQDMIHLSMKGYLLKGRLLAEALLKTIALAAEPTSPDSLIFNVDSLKRLAHIKIDSLLKDSLQGTKKVDEVNFIRHKIAKGETLRSIARLYHVSVASLKKTNGLQNSTIIEGDFLNIEIHASVRKKAQAKASRTKSARKDMDKYVLHLVANGDTLGQIAEKYKVSVTQIKKLNGLKTSRIKAGHFLKIKPKSIPAAGR